MVALPKSRLTVPEFFDWWDVQEDDARFELVDGVVVLMGLDRVRHNQAKMRAVNVLSAAISKAALDCTAFIDGIGVSPDEKTYRLPDAVVNCGPFDVDAYILPNPVVVVEVVSPSSEERDVHSKLRDYFAIPSVAHYLIVYDDRRYVVHHRRRAAGEPVETTFATGGDIDLSPPGLSIAVQDLLGSLDR